MNVISVVGVIFALVVLGIIIALLLKRQLREKYAVMWLVIGVAFLVLAVFPGILNALARVLGVQVPSNLLFALVLALLIGVTLHLSWELSTAEEETRRVAEDVAILRAEVEQLRRHAASGAGRENGADADPD